MAILDDNITKATSYEGDLVLPRLGLSEQEVSDVFATADILIHNGSDMSYLKTYTTLRAVNLQSTKNLAEMCVLYDSKYIPFHYVSTVSIGNVATWSSADADEFVLHPVSVAGYAPPTTMSNSDISKTAHGYIATKLGSEVFMERSHRQHPNWPVVIHRPSLISREEEDASGLEFVENVRRYAMLLNAVPAIPFEKDGSRLSVSGAFDVVPLHRVVEGVTGSVHQDKEGLNFASSR